VDERSGAAAAVEITFRGELLVGEQDRRARHAELIRQRPSRREARSGWDDTVEDAGAEGAMELPEERAVAVEPNPHVVPPSGLTETAKSGLLEAPTPRFR
jgi:hypothetical protein